MKTIDEIKKWLKENLDEERFSHSLGVAKCAKELAEKYNAVFIPCQQIISDAAAKAGSFDLILRDGVHPSVMGHQVLADAWLKYAGHLI